ncbi:putative transcription factor MYB-HB-like family [Helianthus debilis subsp. tardiflorus]
MSKLRSIHPPLPPLPMVKPPSMMLYELNPTAAENANVDHYSGIPWTEDEHKLFLLGLQKVGKGDWRGISRNFVKTHTPTQVEHKHDFTGEIHIFVENHRHTQL